MSESHSIDPVFHNFDVMIGNYVKKIIEKKLSKRGKIILKNPPTATHVTKEINYRLIQKKLLPSVYNFYK